MTQAAQLRFKGIRKVNLRVRDLEDAVGFYRDFLGFEDVRETITDAKRAICRSGHPLNEDSFTIVLTECRSEEVNPGLNYLSVEMSSAREVFDLYERAKRQGIETTDPDQEQGCWRAILSDPDGYQIELMTRDSGGRERLPFQE